MTEAVRAFQARHGLETTGAVDKPTLAEMAVPLAARMRQIQVNLERRRWQNRGLGPDNIYINLADRNVKMVQGGRSDHFVDVTNTDALAGLPTFYGSITGLEIGGGGDVALTVKSPFIGRLAGKDAARTIAVADIAALAGEVLATRGPAGASLDRLMAKGKDTKLAFDPPMPLYVTFVTAWANRDGSIHFRRDTHGRDAKIAALLQLD